MSENPSEVLSEFLATIKSYQEEYEAAKAIVQEEEAKQQDFWHALEFEQNNKQRSKIATTIHKSRVRRREAKDRMQMLEKVVQFARREQTKLLFREIKGLVKEQTAIEERLHSKREWKPRTDALTGGDSNDNPS